MTNDETDTCGYETPSGPCANPATEGDSCWIESHGGHVSGHGRPSTFEHYREELLEAAREPIKTRDVARTAGVGKSTLYDWLNEHDDFSDAFKRARSEAARELVQRGLEDPDVDTSVVRFLLERTFDYIKTETHELEHSGNFDLSLSTDEKEQLEEAFDADPET